MVKFYNWVGLSLLLILSCGNPINITGPKYSEVIVTKMTFYDQLIIKGSRFKDIKAVALRDPITGQIIKRFKVMRYDSGEIIGEQLDYNKIPIPNLLDLLIDTAQGQSVIPVQFSINANSVYTGAIQNGAITPTKFKGVTADPNITSVLTFNPATGNFLFTTPTGGGGGGSGVDEITYGEGIVGDGKIATGTVDITVNVGETGSSTSTYIPYFNGDNAILLDSSGTGTTTRLLFDDGSEQVSLSFQSGIFRIHDETVALPSQVGDLLTIKAQNGEVIIPGSLEVSGQSVCLADGTGCPTGIQPITGVAPIVVTGGSQISANYGTGVGQLVLLEDGASTSTGPGFLPGVDGSHLKNIVTKINALDGITVTNGGIGQVDIGLAPAGATGSAQPWAPALRDISNIAYPPVDGEMIIAASGTYVGQSGATLRASMGLAIGFNVQAWDQDLDTIAGFNPIQGQYIIANAAGDWILGNTGICGAGFVMRGLGPTITCSDESFVFKNRETQWYETSANGTNYLAFTAPAALAGSVIWTLPPADGATGTVLTTNGSGQLSWGSGNGDVRGPASANIGEVAVFSTTNGKNISNTRNLQIADVVARSPTPVTGGHLPEYSGGTGNLIQDSGILATNVVTYSGGAPAPAGLLPEFSGTLKEIQATTIPSANVMTMATPSALLGNVVTSAGGKSAQVSNTVLTDLPTMAASATGTYQPILSFAPGKSLISASYSIPLGICPNGQILKSDGANFICALDTDVNPPVTSVFGRFGAVVAVAGDYTATLVTSLTTGGVGATTVQGAITELDGEKVALAGDTMIGTLTTTTIITTNQNAIQVGSSGANTGEIRYMELSGNGPLYVGFKAPDSIGPTPTIWTLPAADGATDTVLTTNGNKILSWKTPSAIGIGDVVGPNSSTDNAIARFDLTTGKLIKNSTVILDGSGNLTGVTSINGASSSNIVTMTATPTQDDRVFLSTNGSKVLKTTTYSLPVGPCAQDFILKTDVSGNFQCVSASASGVISFKTRTGAVVPADGDYHAVQVNSTPTVNIAANNVQAALNELDTEKLALAGGTMTGQLITSSQNAIFIRNAVGISGELKFEEGTGGQYVGFKSPAAIATNVMWTLPDVIGTNGQVLATVGGGVLQWTSTGGASGIGDVIGPGSSTDNAIARFDLTTGKLIKNSTVILDGSGNLTGVTSINGASSSNIVTMTATPTQDDRVFLSTNGSKVLKTTTYSLPVGPCAQDFILKTDVSGNFQCVSASASGVISFKTRTGAVVPADGDYHAVQVNSTPTVNIAANNVQAALNELDTEKLALAGGTMTGQLITSSQNAIFIRNAVGISGELKFEEGTGGQYVGFKSPAAIATNVMWTLPDVIGTNGQVLATVGGGVLQWTSTGGASGIGDVVGPPSSTDNAIARFNSTSGKLIKDSQVTISNTGDISGVRDLNSTGDFTVGGDGSFTGDLSARSYTNNSDRSLKKDIKPFTGASSIVDKLMPVTFRWKNYDEKQVIGLIAQDLEKVIPEVVSKSNQKGKLVRSYDLGQVLILTLEALKETREELKQTRNDLKVLREKVKVLEKNL